MTYRITTSDERVPGTLFDLNRMLKEMVMKSGTNVIISDSVWMPPTDVYETKGEVVLKLELAGIQPQLVTITIEGTKLTVRGIREELSRDHKRCYHQMEIKYGSFERVVVLECKVNPNGTKASYSDGFLEIRLPKAKKSVQRTVTVELEI